MIGQLKEYNLSSLLFLFYHYLMSTAIYVDRDGDPYIPIRKAHEYIVPFSPEMLIRQTNLSPSKVCSDPLESSLPQWKWKLLKTYTPSSPPPLMKGSLSMSFVVQVATTAKWGWLWDHKTYYLQVDFSYFCKPVHVIQRVMMQVASGRHRYCAHLRLEISYNPYKYTSMYFLLVMS